LQTMRRQGLYATSSDWKNLHYINAEEAGK